MALQSIRADLGKERAVVEVRKRSKEERKEGRKRKQEEREKRGGEKRTAAAKERGWLDRIEQGEGKRRGIIIGKGGGLRNMEKASGIGTDRGIVGVREGARDIHRKGADR